ncbi:MAG TPA: ABC transporter permease [Acidimicrobiales bacterium]|nr:ABC transporter permease [Acidimicrobiales bacterium]
MNATAVAAQTRVELALTLRRGESLLLTLGVPVLLLGFFSLVDVLPLPAGVTDAVDFLAPGILALAVMSTAMVSLAIATGFERSYGVLKRLGSTSLGRPALLAAKTAAVLAVEALQVVVLVTVAGLLGWRPQGSFVVAGAAVLLATVAFAGLGLLMAGTLRAEVTLAAANGLYLMLLLLGGMVFPLERLPAGLETAARLLPAAALTEALDGALSAPVTLPAQSWAVLGIWAVVAPALAAWRFRWE